MSLSLRVQPTTCDKLKAIAKLSSALLAATVACLDYETTREKITFSAYVKRAYTRSLLRSCPPLQLQWLSGSSSTVYRKWIRQHGESEGMKVNTDILDEDGTKLHWIGEEGAKKVILYFHGGGFVIPLNRDHITFMNMLRLELKHDANINVRVAFLEYTLIPAAHFPTQLKQAAQALRYLLVSKRITPSDILLAGDSAGGLLVFQLLSHLLHPHPHIDPIPIPGEASSQSHSLQLQLAGILVVSPWICSDDPYMENDDDRDGGVHDDRGMADFVPAKAVNAWSALMKERNMVIPGSSNSGDSKCDTRQSGKKPLVISDAVETTTTTVQEDLSDNWQQPNKAPIEWWHDTYKYTSHIFLTYGSKELMADDIERFGEQLDKAFRGTKVGVTVASETDGIHCGPMFATLMDKNESEFMDSIIEWVTEQFIKT